MTVRPYACRPKTNQLTAGQGYKQDAGAVISAVRPFQSIFLKKLFTKTDLEIGLKSSTTPTAGMTVILIEAFLELFQYQTRKKSYSYTASS